MSDQNQATDIYNLEPSGKLSRAGVHIGDVNSNNEIVLKPEHKNYKAAVTRWLNAKIEEAEKNATDQEEEEEETDEDGGETPAAPATPTKEVAKPKAKTDEASAEEIKSLTNEAAKEAAKAKAEYKDDTDFANKTGCPQPPKKNPQFGDKTPAYVEWLARYRPDVWRQRFGVKGKGQVAVFKQNADGVEEHVGYREVDMSNRKTHLTEKIENANRGLGEDMDWDA